MDSLAPMTAESARVWLAAAAPEAQGGEGSVSLALSLFSTPLGEILLGATPRGVCLLHFLTATARTDSIERLRRQFGLPVFRGSNPHIRLLEEELAGYFAGKLTQFSVPLDYAGTPFQQRVWQCLLQIPYGETRSYKQVAEAAGARQGFRAVGAANGANPIAIVIPCHRVLNADGSLGGYSSGLSRKRFLLNLEGAEKFLL